MTDMNTHEREALALAVIEHLGPAALSGGQMSILEAFEKGWRAAHAALERSGNEDQPSRSRPMEVQPDGTVTPVDPIDMTPSQPSKEADRNAVLEEAATTVRRLAQREAARMNLTSKMVLLEAEDAIRALSFRQSGDGELSRSIRLD